MCQFNKSKRTAAQDLQALWRGKAHLGQKAVGCEGISEERRSSRKARLACYIITVFMVIGVTVCGLAQAELEETRKVLVLNSYHRGYDWSDRIMDAIQVEFDKTDLDVDLYFEYMDSRRGDYEEALSYSKELYRAKYQDFQFDVIICSDFGAFDLFLDDRDLLFHGAPMVFCGVKQKGVDSMLQGRKSVTGVVEEYDYESTIGIALKFHPSVRQIVLISEDRPAVLRPQVEEFVSYAARLNRQVEIVHFSLAELTMAEFLEKIAGLGDESVVLLLSAMQDSTGETFTRQQSAEMIMQHCTVPIYITGFDWFGLGPVGGKVTNGAYQGQTAAGMAIRILKGEDPNNIPVLTESPNAYMFDYTRLKHFGISVSDLPEGSIVIHQPQSYYYQHKKQVWAVSGLIVGLTLIILLLSMNVLRRKRAEKMLTESEQRLRAIFDNATDGILLADPETKKFSTGNKMICHMLGYDLDELKNLSIKDIHPEEHRAYVTEQFEKQAKGEIALAKDIPVKRRDGSVFYADVNSASVKLSGKTYLMGLFRDITERKRAEEALQKAHHELELRVQQRTAELEDANIDLRDEVSERKKVQEKLIVYQSQLQSLASELSLAEERLRRRIATDIHDHVGQQLAISKIKLESLAESVSSAELAGSLDEIKVLIAEIIKSTRFLTFELSPPVLYELGLEAAVEWLVRQAREQRGLTVEFKDDRRPKPVDNNVRVLLFQAVRELLVNVAKHAHANKVEVSTRRVGDEIRVSVADDGVGFDASRTSSQGYTSGGFGLFSIHERLGHIGGYLRVKSTPGRGTRISLVAPINHKTKGGEGESR
jgi:PAS domain S-box-containing protein